MFGEVIQSPFGNTGINKMMALINDKYFNASADFHLNPPNKGFLTEEMLKGDVKVDPELKVLFWLWRVQRYFLIKKSSKSDTAEHILELLKDLEQLPEPVMRFITVDPIALNCLLFSLLLSRDITTWDFVLTVIKRYNKSPSLLILLDWCYDFYFNIHSLNTCEQVIEQLNRTCDNSSEYKLPDSPLSTLFKFIALTQWYAINPFTKPAPYLASFFPEEEGLKSISCVAYTIDLGIVAEFISNQANACTTSLDVLVKQLLAHFRNPELTKTQLLSELNKRQFESFLDYFIPFCLNNLNTINQEEHLVGLEQIIRFYNCKPLNLCCKIYADGLILVQKLFCLEHYTKAYELYDDLTCFYTGNDSKSLITARCALYAYASNIDRWLKGEEQKPSFNEIELSIIPRIKFLKNDLGEKEIPKDQLYLLAKGLGLKFQREKDKLARAQCENYYSLISEYLTTTQKRELRLLFSTPETVQKTQPKKEDSFKKPVLLPKAATILEPLVVTVPEPLPAIELLSKVVTPPKPKPKPVQQSTTKPVQQSKSKPVQQSTTKPVQQSKSKPVQQSTPKPVQQSTPKPVQQSMPKQAQQSTLKPMQQSMPKPVQQSTPKPVQQSMPKPVQQSTLKPVQQSTPKPVQQSMPKPVQQSTPKPVQQSKSKPVQQSKSKPVQQSKSKPVQQSMPKPVMWSSKFVHPS
jgi:hypothetical protein